jgi:integrase
MFMSVNAVDEAFLLSSEQVDAALGWVSRSASTGGSIHPFLASIAWAALRPGEAQALRVGDALLPAEGPGELLIRAGERREIGGPGASTEDGGVLRRSPAAAELVTVLREEILRRGLGPDDLLFSGPDGGPLSGATYRRIWRQAREAVLTTDEVASPLGRHVIGLRDACIARWLSETLEAPKVFAVAAWAGESVSSLCLRFPQSLDVPAEYEIPWDRMESAFVLPGLET